MSSEPNIIAICGPCGHGKDTIGEYLSKTHGYKVMKFAGKLKEACASIFGLSNEQLEGKYKEVIDDRYGVTPRFIMQQMGTEMFRITIGKIIPKIGNNLWTMRLEESILESKNTNIVLTDLRFANEYEMVKKMSGKIIRVYNPRLTNNRNNHISEKLVMGFDVDQEIWNDGSLELLYKKVDNYLLQSKVATK
jgi:hypothetical protein